jgi:hypothetical protein
MKTTVDEARTELLQAEAHYLAIEKERGEEVVGVATPERVLREIELTGALADAAQRLITAREVFTTAEQEAEKARRSHSDAELRKVELELVAAVGAAERVMSDFEPALRRVIDLSRRRYSYRKDSGRTAPMSLLARGATVGWLQWRLQDLELPDLGVPPHYHRAPLAVLLNLPNRPESKEQNDDKK